MHTRSVVPPHGTASYWPSGHGPEHAAHSRSANREQPTLSNCPAGQSSIEHISHCRFDSVVHGAGHAQRSIGHRLGYAFGPRARMTTGWEAGYYGCELRLPLGEHGG